MPYFRMENSHGNLRHRILDDSEICMDPTPCEEEDEVIRAINKINTGKFADINGISTEH